MQATILIFIGIVQAILFIAHFVVYKSFVFFADIQGKAILTTRIAFLALSLFFMVGSLITAQGFSFAGRAVYTIAAVWLGMLFWLFVGAIFAVIAWQLAVLIFPTLAGAVFVKKMVGLAILIFIISLNIYGLVHAQKIITRTYDVTLPSLPAYWQGKKAVFIADMHFGNIWNLATSQKIVAQIQALKPDIIFISGDFYDGPEINFTEVALPFRALASSTPHGIYYVTGNHEEYRPREQYLKPLREVGITVLENEMRSIEGLNIIGMNYGDSMKLDMQNEVLSELINKNLTGPIIFLKHVPVGLDSAYTHGISLQLSGHTHRGQIWPFSLITKKIYKGYDFGLKDFVDGVSSASEASLAADSAIKKLQVLTTSGAGSWGPPQRIGTDSEIVEILFR